MYFFKNERETKLVINNKKYLRYFHEEIKDNIYLCKFKKCVLNLFFLTSINKFQDFYNSMDLTMATLRNDYNYVNDKDNDSDILLLINNNEYIFNEEKIKTILDSLEVMNELERVKQ